jgi:hypothetical protein
MSSKHFKESVRALTVFFLTFIVAVAIVEILRHIS